jgi:transcriptional/translational regulatory protein YebC/TACO1
MGGNLAESGSVAWQFRRAAYCSIPTAGHDPDRVFELAVEAGADDVVLGSDDIEVFAPVEAFKQINDRLQAAGIRPEEAALKMIPTTTVELNSGNALQVMRVVETLEDLDDVQEVFSNLLITEEAVALLETA